MAGWQGRRRHRAKVQSGAELLCKSAKVSSHGMREGARGQVDMGTWGKHEAVQRCKCGGAACKSAKVDSHGMREGACGQGDMGTRGTPERHGGSEAWWTRERQRSRWQVAGKVGARRCRDRGSERTRRRRVPTLRPPCGGRRYEPATGSDTFRIPNEVRPHCAGGRVADAPLPEAEAVRTARGAVPTSK